MVTALLLGAAYAVVGIVLLGIGYTVVDALTPGRLGDEIYRDRSLNAALVVAAVDLSLGAILFTALWTNGNGLAGLVPAIAFGLLGILLQALTFLLLDAMTPGSLRALSVEPGFHPGSLVTASSMLAIGAVVCASIA